MNPSSNFTSKRILISIGIVVAAALILTGITVWVMKSATTPSVGVVTNVPANQLPQGFPSSTPIYDQVMLVQNFTVDHDSVFQSSRHYISSMPMDQVFENYKAFFADNGWTLSGLSMPDIALSGITFFGTKDSTEAAIHLAFAASSSAMTDVEISFMTPD